MWCRFRSSGTRSGITLLEVAVGLVILGMLAALGVPLFIKSTERSRVSQALTYLSAIRSAQERYRARWGQYGKTIESLGVQKPVPAGFSAGRIIFRSPGSPRDSWSLTLTRDSPAGGYGAYTVTFTEDGFDPAKSTVTTLTDLNPLGS